MLFQHRCDSDHERGEKYRRSLRRELERGFRFDVCFTVDVGRRDVTLAALGRIARSEQNHVAGNVFVLVDLDDVSGLQMTHT